MLVAREAQVLPLALKMIYFNLRPERISWHGPADWDSWTMSIPPSHRMFTLEKTSVMHVWLTSQMAHSKAGRSHQQVIATPVSMWFVAGCKPNAHIRNSQQRDNEAQDVSPAKSHYLLAEVGSRQLPLTLPAQEIRWEDCNLTIL